MRLVTFSANMAEENSYLVVDKTEALLIDPGFNGEAIRNYLVTNNLSLNQVVLTHGHFDHLRDVASLYASCKFTLLIHEADFPALSDDNRNYALAFHSRFNSDKTMPVRKLADRSTIDFAASKATVYHTPGHTKGSISIRLDKWLFTGDTLFTDSVGRTDLMTGSASDLRRSLQLFRQGFPQDILICPGHGERARLAEVLRNNPFLK